MKMEVTLSPKEIEELVRKHLETKFSKVGEVKLEVKKQLVGQHTNEYYETIFGGATCKVEL